MGSTQPGGYGGHKDHNNGRKSNTRPLARRRRKPNQPHKGNSMDILKVIVESAGSVFTRVVLIAAGVGLVLGVIVILAIRHC